MSSHRALFLGFIGWVGGLDQVEAGLFALVLPQPESLLPQASDEVLLDELDQVSLPHDCGLGIGWEVEVLDPQDSSVPHAAGLLELVGGFLSWFQEVLFWVLDKPETLEPDAQLSLFQEGLLGLLGFLFQLLLF